MLPREFIRKWSPGSPAHELNERAGAQAHFIDLCLLPGVPESGRFKSGRSNRDITKEAARTFADAAEWLCAAGVPAETVCHFLTQGPFAADMGLLPGRLFERLVSVQVAPERMRAQLRVLLETTRDGGLVGVDDIAWFNPPRVVQTPARRRAARH
ncbi:MAG: hypothetical protein JNN18_16150, partial [Rubrivivax sp.]|nr:hypothetical protein [Rubrivivax sp.]